MIINYFAFLNLKFKKKKYQLDDFNKKIGHCQNERKKKRLTSNM